MFCCRKMRHGDEIYRKLSAASCAKVAAHLELAGLAQFLQRKNYIMDKVVDV